jgi:hypothetical protein
VTIPANKKLVSFHPFDGVNVVCLAQTATVTENMSEDKATISIHDSDLTEEQKRLVEAWLVGNRDVIGSNELDLGETKTVTFKIDVQGAKPVKHPYRRFTGPLKQEILDEVAKFMKKGIIEKSQSEWASQIVPVRKKSGKLRLCIDYRAVNNLSKQDAFPLPNLEDSVSQFRDNMYFSSLDMLAGYHQISVDPESREYTAFSTGSDLYQYKVLPYGITNGPAVFSRLMSIVLSGIPSDQALAYLDDIIVAGKSFDEHLENLELVFKRLRMHGLKLNAAKCELFKKEVNFLGHTLSREGVTPLKSNIQAILDFEPPKTIKEVRRFCGMVNFYKKFIVDSDKVMRHLYQVKSGSFEWTDDCQSAFLKAKRSLIEAPVLAFPDYSMDKPFVLTVDASNEGAGAVLSQVQEEGEKVIGYFGTGFNKAQKRYSATDKELAAIRLSVNHFRTYLYGRKYTIGTDHQPLVYFSNIKRVNDRLMRTSEDLLIGQYLVEYVPGKNNVVADCLSRAHYPAEEVVGGEVCEREIEAFDTITVPGGPDSLFVALSLGIYDNVVQSSLIREQIIDTLVNSMSKFGLTNNAENRNHIMTMREPGIFPSSQVLPVIAEEFNVNLMVLYGNDLVVKFPAPSVIVVHLACLGGIHYNLLKIKN